MEQEELIKQLKDFCENKNQTTAIINNYGLVKMHYNKDFDWIYNTTYIGNGFSFENKLECYGFYNKKTKVLYTLHSYPYYDCPFAKPITLVKEPVYDEILRQLTEWCYTITPEDAYNDDYEVEEYFVEYQCDSMTRKAILNGFTSKDFKMEANFKKDLTSLTDEQVCRLTLDTASVIKEVVEALKVKVKRTAYSLACESELIRQRMAQYEANPDDVIFRLAKILKAIDTNKMQMVTLTIRKDGKEMTFKYPTISIHSCIDERWMSEYNIPAKEREIFKETYGRNADFCGKDIIKVEYGKKVLFQL